MIGWKAKYGYYDIRKYPDQIAPKYLSDIVFTDDGPFTFPTTLHIPSGLSLASYTSSVAVASTPTKEYGSSFQLSVGLENLFGEDYFKLYLAPSPLDSRYPDNNNYNPAIDSIPSIFKACPNLLAFFNSFGPGNVNSEYYVGVVYIPALKRVLLTEQVLALSQNGTLTTLNNGFTNYGPELNNYMTTNSSSFFFCGFVVFPNWNGTRDSLDFSYLVQITLSNIYHEYCINKQEGNAQQDSYISSLFGDYVAPDIDIPDNPYDPVDPSGPTNPDIPPGTFDDESDPIAIPPLPTISAANTGFTRIYNPTLAQVQQLAKYLWTDDTVIETIWNHIKQYFEDPMQAIIGFNLVPVPVPDGGTKSFALMYLDTGVQMTAAASQFVDVDCGTLQLKRYYGSALDQSPYTKIHCFLPYIGTVQLDTDEIMGTTLGIVYRVDIVTGSCVAMITVDGNVLYQYSGHCAINIPISSADFSSYVSAAINIAKNVGMAVAAGASGGAALAAAPAVQSTGMTAGPSMNPGTSLALPSTSMIPSQGGGQMMPAHIPINPLPGDYAPSTQASFSGLQMPISPNTAGQIMSAKREVQHSGSFTGNSGYLGVRRPFLIIERPNMCLPNDYHKLVGYPSMIRMNLGSCKGFTKVQQVQLTGLAATNPEQDEILNLLKGGVVF